MQIGDRVLLSAVWTGSLVMPLSASMLLIGNTEVVVPEEDFIRAVQEAHDEMV